MGICASNAVVRAVLRPLRHVPWHRCRHDPHRCGPGENQALSVAILIQIVAQQIPTKLNSTTITYSTFVGPKVLTKDEARRSPSISLGCGSCWGNGMTTTERLGLLCLRRGRICCLGLTECSPGEGLICMRGAIRASGGRPRSAVELLIERLVPFKQRPPARPIVQFHEIHRGAAPLQLLPFILYLGALLTPFVEFGIKGLLSRSMGVRHSIASICLTHSNASVVRLRMASLS